MEKKLSLTCSLCSPFERFRELTLRGLVLVLLFPLWGLGDLLLAQSVVRVSQLSRTEGNPPTLTFHVGWEAPSPSPSRYRDTVWIFADYRLINADGSTGIWQPAPITAATVIAGDGKVIQSTINGRGFYLDGHGYKPFNSTVRITLAAPVDARFNACVYVSDYPPNATQNPNGGYTLKGTPPFTIKTGSGTVSEPTYTFATGRCIDSITDPTGCPGIVINRPFTAGQIDSTGQTICNGVTPNVITSSASATGGDGHFSYQWRLNNTTIISGATAATYGPTDKTTPGAHTYTRWVHDGSCNTEWVKSDGEWVLTVRDAFNAGAITAGASTAELGGTKPNTVIGSSSFASGGGNNITYQWRRTGTSGATLTGSAATYNIGADNYSAVGTYYIRRYAQDATCNTGWVASANTYTLTVKFTPVSATNCSSGGPTLTKVGFTSGNTYSINGLIVSSPVTVTECNKTDYSASSSTGGYKSACRSNPSYGHLFSWCMVARYAKQLCPSPWRVPTENDLLRMTGQYASNNGWALGGYCDASGGLHGTGTHGYYWSSDQDSDISKGISAYVTSTTISKNSDLKSYGYTLRCVR